MQRRSAHSNLIVIIWEFICEIFEVGRYAEKQLVAAQAISGSKAAASLENGSVRSQRGADASSYRQALDLSTRCCNMNPAPKKNKQTVQLLTKLVPMRIPSSLSRCTTLASSSPISLGIGFSLKHVVAPL